MACGIPVISTNVGSIPELITSPNEGILLPPNDHESLVSALLELIKSGEMRTKLGNNARKKVHKDYSWKLTTNKYLSVYEKIDY